MWTMTWTEVGGFITTALCVWLVVRRNIWNFPIGIASNIFFWVLFIRAGLYADAWLQVVFLLLGVGGWWMWLHGGVNRTALVVRRTPVWGWAAIAGFVGVATWVIYTLLTAHTDSTVPVADAFTTALSLGAQIMLNRKWIGNWALWMVADVLYIWLYWIKDLHLTSVLYVGLLTMCVIGLRQWVTALRRPEPAPVAEAVAA